MLPVNDTHLQTYPILSSPNWQFNSNDGARETDAVISYTFLAVLVIQAVIALSGNILLMAVILYSPSLKTPPNAHLVNICITNILLCFEIAVSVLSTLSSTADWPTPVDHANLRALQSFMLFCCFLQYCYALTAIAYHRHKTVQTVRTTGTVKYDPNGRRRVLLVTMAMGWSSSLISAAILTYISESNTSSGLLGIGLDKYKCSKSTREVRGKVEFVPISPVLQLFSVLVLLSVMACVGVVVYSYCSLYVSHERTGPPTGVVSRCVVSRCGQTRVSPWFTDGPSSYAEYYAGRDVRPATRKPANRNMREVRRSLPDNDRVYRPGERTLFSVDDIRALEFPKLANGDSTPRRFKAADTSGPPVINLEQLSAADVLRFSDLRRASRVDESADKLGVVRASEQRALRREPTGRGWGRGGATRNGIVMVAVFVMCSVPLFVSCMPGVLPGRTSRDGARRTWLMCCRILFHFNALLFPLWYLVFSARVRRNLCKLYSSTVKSIKNIYP